MRQKVRQIWLAFWIASLDIRWIDIPFAFASLVACVQWFRSVAAIRSCPESSSRARTLSTEGLASDSRKSAWKAQ
jgi:hypothetical protein